MDPHFRKAVLQQVKTLGPTEIKKTLDNPEYKFTLSEFIENGLSNDQLEALPNEDIANEIKGARLDLETLERCGVSENKLQMVKAIIFPPIEEDEPPLPPPPTGVKEKIYIDIIESRMTPELLRNHLLEGKVSKSDLIENTSLSLDIVERIDKYSKQPTVTPELKDLPPLEKDRTDFYFLGMPGSGKSTMLAGLLAYCNRKGLIVPTMQNLHGENYKKQLIQELLKGILPNSTPTELINYIPLDMREFEKRNRVHPLNFIDMAGEKFRQVANGGMTHFTEIKNYLNNNNRKTLLFIIDYNPDKTDDIFEQDHNLQMVLAQMEKFGTLDKTDSVYLVVSKADLFPSANKQEFADEYIKENFANFLELCKSMKDKYRFRLSSASYSIGPSVLNNLLIDFNPKTNTNLDTYPENIAKIVLGDSFTKKTKFFGL